MDNASRQEFETRNSDSRDDLRGQLDPDSVGSGFIFLLLSMLQASGPSWRSALAFWMLLVWANLDPLSPSLCAMGLSRFVTSYGLTD